MKISLLLAVIFLYSCEDKSLQSSRFELKQFSDDRKQNLAELKNDVFKNVGRDLLSPKLLGHKHFPDNLSGEGLQSVCATDEFEFNHMKRNFILGLEKQVTEKRMISDEFIAANVDSNFFSLEKKNRKLDKEIVLADWKINKTQNFKTDLFKNKFNSYLGEFQAIDGLRIEAYDYFAPRKFRAANLEINQFLIKAHFNLKGITKDGRRHDQGKVSLSIKKENNQWKISQFNFENMKTVSREKAGFKEITSKVIPKLAEYRRLEAIRRGGYSISLSDYDQDGHVDMFVGAYGDSKLFKGSKSGKFEAQANDVLENEKYVKSSIFADLDNDEDKDLILVKFVPNHVQRSDRTDVVIYENVDGTTFEKGKFKFKDLSLSNAAMPAALADFNQDGFLDLYVGFPGARDFTTFGRVFNNKGYKIQGIYLNDKTGNLATTANGRFLASRDNEMLKIFPHSALATDFNDDGKTDLIVIDDQQNYTRFYANKGDAGFKDVTYDIGIKQHGYGMGAAHGDLDNDGKMDILLSSVNFLTATRMQNACMRNWSLLHENFENKGLTMFKSVGKNKFAEVLKPEGLEWPGEGLGGVELIDYNNDGKQDIYISNGLWSGNSRKQDLSFLFALGLPNYKEYDILEERVTTQSTIMNILANFQGDIYSEKKSSERPHLAGFQKNRLYRNIGNGTFIDVAYVEGVDSLADGYIMAKADLDKDGDMDIILRNADPGTDDVSYPPVQIFENLTTANSLILSLKNKEGRDYIGTKVVVRSGKQVQTQILHSNNGTAQSEQVVHFGLGTKKHADKITLYWPNGKVASYTNIKNGHYVIRENQPKTVKIVSK